MWTSMKFITDSLQDSHRGHCHILCGDFNCKPSKARTLQNSLTLRLIEPTPTFTDTRKAGQDGM